MLQAAREEDGGFQEGYHVIKAEEGPKSLLVGFLHSCFYHDDHGARRGFNLIHKAVSFAIQVLAWSLSFASG